MLKPRNLATFFVTLIMIAGCKSSESPTAAAPKEHFQLTNESHRSLNDVRCSPNGTKIVCEDIAELYGIKDMSWTKRNLENKKALSQKRLKVLSQVFFELDEAMKKEWSLETQETLNSYHSSVFAMAAELPAAIGKLEAEITNEDLFQTTLGYKCSGQYGEQEADLVFDQSLLFNKSMSDDNEKILYVTPTTKVDSEVKVSYRTNGKNFRLRIGSDADVSKNKMEVNVLAIRMDGEFSVDWSGEPYRAQVSCLRKTALEINPTLMTQRITERARLKCEIFGIKPNTGKTDLEYVSGSNIEANFGIEESSDGLFSEMFAGLDEKKHPYMSAGIKYSFDVGSHNGELVFTLKNLETNAIVAAVKTRNSSDSINLNYLNKGYGASIDCKVPQEK